MVELVRVGLSRSMGAGGDGGGAPSPTLFNQMVTNRMGFPTVAIANTGTTGGGTATQQQQWTRFYVAYTCTGLYLVWGNFTANPSVPSQIDLGPAQVAIKAAVKPNAGTTVQGIAVDGLTPGTTTLTLDPGSYGTMFFPGTFTGPLPRVILRQLTTYASIPANWPGCHVIVSQADEFNEFGTGLTDRTLAASWAGSRPTLFSVLPPLCGYSKVSSALGPSVMIIGDSVGVAGNNDTTFGEYVGFMQRGLARAQPWMLNGSTGMGLNVCLTTPAQVSRRFTDFLAYLGSTSGWTHALCELMTNDLSQGVTAATMKTNQGTLKTLLLAGGAKLLPTSCMPRTDSSNTTVPPGEPNTWTQRALYNVNMVTDNGNGNGYFDLAACWQDSINNNLWRSDIGPIPDDGIHPKTAHHTFAGPDAGAQSLASQALALFV